MQQREGHCTVKQSASQLLIVSNMSFNSRMTTIYDPKLHKNCFFKGDATLLPLELVARSATF